MSAWILVPCLVALREEFNAVAPQRDRGSDGSIGDSAHTSSSDHTPDEDSDILRDHDADHKNEVHALDIDSSGPWPHGPGETDFQWFDRATKGIVARERARWLDPRDTCRLEYVIWNRQIASRSIDDFRWREYHGTADPHTGHAHFSARYITAAENDTSPYGIEDDMTPEQLQAAIVQALDGTAGQAAISKAAGRGVHNQALGRSNVTIGAALQGTSAKTAALVAAVAALPEATVAELGDETRTAEEQAALLRAVLGDRAAEVGRLLAS